MASTSIPSPSEAPATAPTSSTHHHPQPQSSSPPVNTVANKDYDLSHPLDPNGGAIGLRQNLTSYGDAHFSLFMRKLFIKAMGYSEDALSRPIIGIVNTYSSFNPCHANIPQLIDAVKRGVQLNGGLAIDFPTISLHESFASPTSMYLRNLMSMDTEEMVKAQPVDAVVLIGGCDKTTPAQLMGGISANKPIIHLITGPMMPGSFQGTRVGACTDCRNNWAKFRAGTLDIEDMTALNEELAPTSGTCGVMGTASTMACLLVALGLMPLSLPSATAPAVSSARLRVAEHTGALAVQLSQSQLKPQDLLTRESFLNAITVLQAIGGSTNAIVHLMAIINRHPSLAGTISLRTIDDIGRKTPLLVDLKPSGNNYMTDFHNAGGMLALLHQLRPLLHLDAMTVTGRTLGEELDSIPFRPLPLGTELSQIIHPFSSPLYPSSSLAVFDPSKSNLCPLGGAVIKASASKYRRLLQHRGQAVVFNGPADLARRIDSPDLDVTPDSVLILQHIGPIGLHSPGMPEAGMIPIPRKLAVQGVEDMLRISDGRMSGTAGGTIVLHVSPEAADPESVLGVVRDGDWIVCDVEGRSLEVELSGEEIERRKRERREEMKGASKEGEEEGNWQKRERMRGYRGLYMREVNQAEEGADFGFLTAAGPKANEKGEGVK
ncbi:dihydroxy-acid/6-phosphogluconate dehydratase [Copromyces sp. CBS 386.78]|nr:dihydroxy-acid/6-phosphogluconate dehydratase [Copromyces sp. CBS 386.78]